VSREEQRRASIKRMMDCEVRRSFVDTIMQNCKTANLQNYCYFQLALIVNSKAAQNAGTPRCRASQSAVSSVTIRKLILP
jgi:hypothetical protein